MQFYNDEEKHKTITRIKGKKINKEEKTYNTEIRSGSCGEGAS